MKKKYLDYYVVENGIVFDSKNNIIDNEEIRNILKKYPIPQFLTDIKLLAKTLKEADNGIVYIGKDERDRIQYIYGIEYVKNRSLARIKVFLRVENKRHLIDEYISKQLIKDEVKYEDLDENILFAICLLIELTFYIRTGKRKYLDDNSTVGLTTFQKRNFTVKEDIIEIQFNSKANKLQKFTIYKNTQPILFKCMLILYNSTKNDNDFIFHYNNKVFTEFKLCKMLKNIFGLVLKDIRVYGVNRVLITQFWKETNNESYTTNIKKYNNRLISDVIKKTADIIGHTPGASNKSYILPELKYIFKRNLIKQCDFETFYNSVVKILASTLK